MLMTLSGWQFLDLSDRISQKISEINYFGFSNKLRIFLLKSSALISFFIVIFLQYSISFYYQSFWKINGYIPEIDSMTFEMNRWKIFSPPTLFYAIKNCFGAKKGYFNQFTNDFFGQKGWPYQVQAFYNLSKWLTEMNRLRLTQSV